MSLNWSMPALESERDRQRAEEPMLGSRLVDSLGRRRSRSEGGGPGVRGEDQEEDKEQDLVSIGQGRGNSWRGSRGLLSSRTGREHGVNCQIS